MAPFCIGLRETPEHRTVDSQMPALLQLESLVEVVCFSALWQYVHVLFPQRDGPTELLCSRKLIKINLCDQSLRI